MTEWERSHRDKGEGGQIEQGQEKEADEGAGEEGEFKLMLSVMIATEGAAGLWFHTMAEKNKADG